MPAFRYRSTRGGQRDVGFEEAVMTGLAHDRGLFVPEEVPQVDAATIESWRALSFPELAFQVLSQYVSPAEIPHQDLKRLIENSTVNFRDKEVTPVRRVGDIWVLELFHGPTFAFKDVALQFLGNLFEFFLERKEGSRLTIMGATSGDTGSAAIYGLRGKKNVNCFILFPEGRVSPIQERQMTTVPDDNIHCLAIKGTFDDCQDTVKAAFADKEFRDKVSLGAVNSINWARVLAQMTYYFYAYYRVTDKDPSLKGKVNFSVPTGNFGDILAGYYAKRMGLAVGQLCVGTNENDILHRFFTTGKYHRAGVQETIAPSMDICVSSNFERYLFHLSGDNSQTLAGWFKGFEETGELTVEGDLLKEAQQEFCSGRVDMPENLAIIKDYFQKHKYLLCPHSSVGVGAATHAKLPPPSTVCLMTAHPAKFPAAIKKVIPAPPAAPAELAALSTLSTRVTPLPLCQAAIQAFVSATLAGQTGAGARATAMAASTSTSARGLLGAKTTNVLFWAGVAGVAGLAIVAGISLMRS
eukprot:CAMPEP_0113934024 /NCGR_PEP_ID=MMETSP1339-20121228/1357_1 /TAXON_ID=94617 /ORGANISM="Fibrocapsa japonica" /LENGTH=524 /DNA_ID=CAMNT_0000935629 /DNA_START=57 /DNA_END=1631 /DNA_ORIENTATION=+ /assembly_acc=CAM_ASM_000762